MDYARELDPETVEKISGGGLDADVFDFGGVVHDPTTSGTTSVDS